MKALSVRQPWAWLIIHGGKDFENRDWAASHPCRKFRGKFYVHAAKGMTRDEYATARAMADDMGIRLPEFHQLERGGIIGTAKAEHFSDRPISSNWAFGSGIVLSEPAPLPFTPCRGMLGFFTPDLSVEDLHNLIVSAQQPQYVNGLCDGCGAGSLELQEIAYPPGSVPVLLCRDCLPIFEDATQ